MKIKSERKCVACKKTKPFYEFGVIYAPRTPHEKGWMNTQCKSCFSSGGIEVEEKSIKAALEKSLEEFNTLKEEIKDIRCLLRHIDKKTIMTQCEDKGEPIRDESEEDALSSLFLE
jgi:hypothetical protein